MPAMSRLYKIVRLLPPEDGHLLYRIKGSSEPFERDAREHTARSSNAVWDGHRVRVFGARNEVVAFQLIVEADASGIDQLAVAPLSSFGLALSTFVAQNRGAGQWARIRTGVLHTSVLTWAVALLLGGLIVGFGTPIVTLFVGPGEAVVVELAHQYLIVQGALYPLLASLFVLRYAIQGLGATAVPTIAGFMELAFRAGAGLLLVGPLGFLGVALAAPLAWLGALLPVLVSWLRRRQELLRLEQLSAVARTGSDTQPVPAA